MEMRHEACVAEINHLIALGAVHLSAPTSLLMRGDVVAPSLGISYETLVLGGRIASGGWMCLKIDGETVSTHLPGVPHKSPASFRAGYRKFLDAVKCRMDKRGALAA